MATLAGQTCPSCLAHGVTSHLGSNGVCGRCWRKAEEPSAPVTIERRDDTTRAYTVWICDGCYLMKPEACNTPGCAFCRCSVAEIKALLSAIQIRPLVDGEYLDLYPEGPEPSLREAIEDVARRFGYAPEAADAMGFDELPLAEWVRLNLKAKDEAR